MTSSLLICSVGGSPDPVVSAIRTGRPSRVLFVATEDEPGSPGSAGEITKKDGIASCAGLDETSYTILIVPKDDPDRTFILVLSELQEIRRRNPTLLIVADYTGGTKSMSGALIAAAVSVDGTALQIMAGQRPDLRSVKSGTERVRRLDTGWLLAERTAGRYRESWRNFGYAEAAEGLSVVLADVETDEAAPPVLLQRLRDLRDLSGAFAAWDRFDHQEAKRRLTPIAPRYPGWLRPWLEALDRLIEPETRQPAVLFDLWCNAERRAARGQYDDAVARLYRLIEWTGQWILKRDHGFNTAKPDFDAIPREVRSAAGIDPREGQRHLGGLTETLKLCAAWKADGSVARFWRQPVPHKKDRRTGERELRNMLDLRNKSILAHQDRPLVRADWDRFAEFLDKSFGHTVLLPEARAAGQPASMAQLPTEPPAGL